MKNENDVKKRVKKLLEQHGWFWWAIGASMYGKGGTSDIHALKSGVFLAIETKFGRNTITPLQRGFLESINAEGGFAFVVNEKNVEWLQTFLKKFGDETDRVAAEKQMSHEGGATLLDAIRALQALI